MKRLAIGLLRSYSTASLVGSRDLRRRVPWSLPVHHDVTTVHRRKTVCLDILKNRFFATTPVYPQRMLTDQMDWNTEIFIGYLRVDIEPEILKRNLIALFATIGVDVNTDLVQVMRRQFASHAYVKFRSTEDCRQVLAGFGSRYDANRHAINVTSITQPGKQLLVEPRQLTSNSSYYMRPPSSTTTNDTPRSEEDIDFDPIHGERRRRSSLGVMDPRYALQETVSSNLRLGAISEHGQPMEHASSLSISTTRQRRLETSTPRDDRCARSATVIDDQGLRMRALISPTATVVPEMHDTESNVHSQVQLSVASASDSSPETEQKSGGQNACNSAGGGSGRLRGVPAVPPVPPSVDGSLDIDLTPATRQPVPMTVAPNVPCTLRQCISAGSNLPREPESDNDQRTSQTASGATSRTLGRRGFETLPSLYHSTRPTVDEQELASYAQKAMMSTSSYGRTQVPSSSQDTITSQPSVAPHRGRSALGSVEELPLLAEEEQEQDVETKPSRPQSPTPAHARSPAEGPSSKLTAASPSSSARRNSAHFSTANEKSKYTDARKASAPFDDKSAARLNDGLHDKSKEFRKISTPFGDKSAAMLQHEAMQDKIGNYRRTSVALTNHSAALDDVPAYVLGTKLGNETRHREFKSGQGGYVHKQLRDHVAKYAVAFLNSEGGTLIIGVNDDGVVLGISINQHLEDILRQKIDAVIKDISPQVFPAMYRVNFCPVEDNDGNTLEDVKILEIMVRKSGAPQLYQTPRGDVYMRRDGSVQGPLKATDIQEWTRMVMREEYKDRGHEMERLREQQRTLTKQLETATLHYDKDTKVLQERFTDQRATREELETQLMELRKRISDQPRSKKSIRRSGLCSLL